MNNKLTTVEDCKIVSLPKIQNTSGNITALENKKSIPFDVNRVYYLYDVPSNEERGGHAHYELEHYLVAGSGSFDIVLKDGNQSKIVNINRPDQALHIVPGIWRELQNFSGGSICLVLASLKFDENDYLRDFTQFLNWKIKNNESNS